MRVPNTVRRRARAELQRVYLKLRPFGESIGSIRYGDPAAARFASFGPASVVVHPQVAIINPASVSIGTDTYIDSYVVMEAYAYPDNVVIDIGDRIHLGHYVRLVAFSGIIIEDLVAIGHGCTVADAVHDWRLALGDESRPLWDTPPRPGGQLRICRGAWIGNGTIVNGPVTIGEWCIVDANCVVKRDVPPRTMISGSPARVLRAQHPDGTWKKVEGTPLLEDYASSLTSSSS